MTREQARELIPVIQAFADGKTIQTRNGDSEWFDCQFLCNTSPWRVKPEPQELWLVKKDDGPWQGVYDTPDPAKVCANLCTGKIVHVMVIQ